MPGTQERGRTLANALGGPAFAGLETIFCWGTVSVYCLAFLPALRFFNNDVNTLSESDPTNQMLQVIILLVMAGLSLIYWRDMLALVRRSWGSALIVAFCFGSALWSDDPMLTIRRATVFGVTTLFAIYVAARFSLNHFAKIVSFAGLFMALASLALVVTSPAVGLEQLGQNSGLPRGVFATKNVMGHIMMLCSVFALWIAIQSRSETGVRFRRFYAGVALLCLALALWSRSSTVLIGIIAASGAWVSAALIRRYPAWRIGTVYLAVAAVVVLLAAIIIMPEQAAGLLGKDDTLSGRDELWAAVHDYIAQRPWLGYGYGAFWREDGAEATTIWQMIQWVAPHAHNAVLEILLELGRVGLVVAVGYHLYVFGRLSQAIWRGQAWAAPLAAALVAIVAQGLTEANALRQGDIGWVILVLADLLVARRALALGALGSNPVRTRRTSAVTVSGRFGTRAG